jgi:hypothetical protein
METRTRRQAGVLGVLIAALAIVLWWNFAGGSAPSQSGRAGQRGRGAAASPASTAARPVDVALESLKLPRPEPAGGARNPFRFTPRPAEPQPEPPPTVPGGVVGPDGRVLAGGPPAGPPPPPPIPLKFIGIVEEPSAQRRLAALSDGRFTYYGREGDIIEGRYRIVRIGLESIEMVHLDGRGPQTIRLSGS